MTRLAPTVGGIVIAFEPVCLGLGRLRVKPSTTSVGVLGPDSGWPSQDDSCFQMRRDHDTAPCLSIVISCYNAADTIADTLEGISRQRWSERWEVIVADNGVTDGSLAIVESFKDRVRNLRIVDASDRRCQAHAMNVGARAAAAGAIVFCDADDVPAPGWVAAIGDALSEHDFVASCLDKEALNRRDVAVSRELAQQDGLEIAWYPPFLPHAGGCGLGVRKSLLEMVGGFDESFRYLHDTDFCFKLQKRGIELRFIPDAVYQVRFRREAKDIFRQARRWAAENMALYKRYRPHRTKVSRPWRQYMRTWVRIARRLHRKGTGDVASRLNLMWRIGWQVGLLEGSVKHRVAPISYAHAPKDNSLRASTTAEPGNGEQLLRVFLAVYFLS